MTTQPEALRLAEALEDAWRGVEMDEVDRRAAAELRRLHAVNQELVEALRKCSAQLTRLGYSANHADAALVKAEGQA